MTRKEKVEAINPEKTGAKFIGGVMACPTDYEYLHLSQDDKLCEAGEYWRGWKGACETCWNMELEDGEVKQSER